MTVTSGVSFDGLHSYNDFGMYLVSRPILGMPPAKLSTVDVLGMNGTLDLTEANTGSVCYSNRTLEFTFSAMVDYDDQPAFRKTITNALHGKRIERIILDNDDQWYYSGRCSVDFTEVSHWKIKCVVTVDADPFAKAIEGDIVYVVRDFADPPIVPIATTKTVDLDGKIVPCYDGTDRRFGTYNEPLLDVSAYTTIRLYGNQKQGSNSVRVIIESSNGTYDATAFNVGDFIDILVSDMSQQLDVTQIYRIYTVRYFDCFIYGTGTLVEINHDFGEMPVVPQFQSTYNSSATMTYITFIVGGKSYQIPEGAYVSDDVVIPPGTKKAYLSLTNYVSAVSEFTIYCDKGKL